MGGRLIVGGSKTPGVGSYSVDGNILKGAKGGSMGNLTPLKNYYPSNYGPGPGGYSVIGYSSNLLPKGRAASMGTLLPDIAFKQANIAPGPGEYGSPGFTRKIDGKGGLLASGGHKLSTESRGNDKHLND